MGIFLLSFIKNSQEKKFLWKMFLTGFGIRLLLIIIMSLDCVKAYSIGCGLFWPDEMFYHKTAMTFIEAWRHGSKPNLIVSDNYLGFIYYVSAIYYVFGNHPIIVKIFNSFISIMICFLVYCIAGRLYNKKIAKKATWMAIIFPSLISYSCFVLKDILIIFFMTLCVWALISQKDHRLLSWLTIGLCFVALHYLRIPMTWILLLVCIAYFIICVSFPKVIKIGVIFLALFLIPYMPLNFQSFLKEQVYSRHLIYTRSLSKTSLYNVFGGRMSINIFNLHLLLMAFLFVILVPFPLWVLINPNFSTLVNLPEALFWYGIIPYALVGIIHSIRERKMESLLILVFICIMVFMISVACLGTVESARYRAPIEPMVIIFSAAGMHLAGKNFFKFGIPFYICTLTFWGAVYLFLKLCYL